MIIILIAQIYKYAGFLFSYFTTVSHGIYVIYYQVILVIFRLFGTLKRYTMMCFSFHTRHGKCLQEVL